MTFTSSALSLGTVASRHDADDAISSTKDTLNIYADGSFDASSQSGGWAFVVMDVDRQVHIAEGTMIGSSNNTFEVLSVVRAVSWLEAEVSSAPAIIWTDSLHVFEGCSRWRFIWRGNGWKRVRSNSHERLRGIPDVKLWQELDALLDRNPQLRIKLCKGHSGLRGNELADAAANRALAGIRRPV